MLLLMFVSVGIGLGIFWRIARRNTFLAQMKEITLNLGTPLGENELRILHLSDLHVERLSVSSNELIRKCRNYPLDLIALTGDYLDRVESIPKFLSYLDEIVKLNPKYGVFAVFGNHDYCIDPHLPQLKEEMEKRGCRVLINEHYTINLGQQKLNIIGIDDDYSGHSDIERSYAGIEDGINLVLTHDPTVVLKMEQYHFDYMLSGHFHGGQILYPRAYHLHKMSELPKRQMIKGLHFYNKKAIYISEGLGQTGVNIRLRSRPEITMHRLGCIKKAS